MAGRQDAEDVIENLSQMIRNATVPTGWNYGISAGEVSVLHEEPKTRVRGQAMDSSGDTRRKRLG